MKKVIIFFAIIITFILSYTILLTNVKLSLISTIHKQIMKISEPVNKTKYILYWTKMFDREDFYLGLGDKIFENCPISNCVATDDKTIKNVEEFDAIVFHVADFNMKMNLIPWQRTNEQIYIFGNVESPFYYTNYLSYTKNFFNWTMTYRQDSDIVRSYGNIVSETTNYEAPTVEEIIKKKNKVAWLVSNCNANSKREVLVKKLQNYIQVDIFGKCGPFHCVGRMSAECYSYLEKNYKFYLSFENAICEDYITEKLYNLLEYNIIPVVYGGGNYTKFTPPYSVIDVNDFQTIPQLADYLNYLSNNPIEYLKYFQWKKHFTVNSSLRRKDILCKLCEKLHNKPTERKIYENISDWWRGGKNFNICKYEPHLPPILYT